MNEIGLIIGLIFLSLGLHKILTLKKTIIRYEPKPGHFSKEQIFFRILIISIALIIGGLFLFVWNLIKVIWS